MSIRDCCGVFTGLFEGAQARFMRTLDAVVERTQAVFAQGQSQLQDDEQQPLDPYQFQLYADLEYVQAQGGPAQFFQHIQNAIQQAALALSERTA